MTTNTHILDLYNFPVQLTNIVEAFWQATTPFRAVVDATTAKNYVLALFFLRYVSDFEEANPSSLGQQTNGIQQRMDAKSRENRFYLPPGCDFKTLYERRNEPYLGEIINSILKAIEEANHLKLSGIFHHLDFNSEANLGAAKERNKLLRYVIEGLADERLETPSLVKQGDKILQDTFEELLYRFARECGKSGNEFYTPAEVSLLLAKLLQPQRGNRICDPACGSGSLLLRLAKEIPGENCSLFGQEIDRATWAICKMNMLIHSQDEARIEWGDTLVQPKLVEGDKLMRFNIVASTLPFIHSKWNSDLVGNDQYKRFRRGVPTGNRSEFAFISHMIESANAKTGKVGVIVPHGVLFRGGNEKKIRQAIIEENLLEAVVGLPPHLFFETPIPVVILIFNRSKASSDVMFVNANGYYIEWKYLGRKKLHRLNVNRMDEIVNFVRNRETRPYLSQRVSLQQIAANDFDLSIARYIDTSVETRIEPAQALLETLAKLEQELAEVRGQIDDFITEVTQGK